VVIAQRRRKDPMGKSESKRAGNSPLLSGLWILELVRMSKTTSLRMRASYH